MPRLFSVKLFPLFLLTLLGSLADSGNSQSAENEGSNEGLLKGIFSPKWPAWENDKGSIILPILSNPGGSKDEEKRSTEEEPSIFSQAALAFSNFAETGINQLKNQTVAQGLNSYVQNLTQRSSMAGKDAFKIVGNTLDTFHDVAFPTQNTTLLEGFSNVVKEVQATNQELGGFEQVQNFATGLGDQAKKLVGIDVDASPEKSTTGVHREIKTLFGLTTPEPESSELGTTWIIIIAGIAIVSVIIIVGTIYIVLQRKKKSSKQAQVELQSAGLNKDEAFREQLNTLLKQDV
ncbi:unnamed protein product [Allacma fusca]|uniref:Uncharacterized protein n=1 Tax=Allacma fusca TaxID=39272 RepID=A0A8J2KSP8_9HEXA|nr:unnamed protein product [Allacma fusca]